MSVSLPKKKARRRFGRTSAFTTLRRRFAQNWLIYRHNRIAVLGLILLILFSLAPITFFILRQDVWQNQMYDPITGFDLNIAPHPAPPSWFRADWLAENNVHRFDFGRPNYDHLLGTDTLGRDIAAVLLASTGHSFIIGITAAVTTATIGLLIAAYSAYYRGWIDLIFGYISDAFLLLPAPIFMIAVGSYLRANGTSVSEIIYENFTDNRFSDLQAAIFQPLEFGLIYGIIAGAGGAAIVLRSHGLKVMSLAFIEASRVAGATGREIIWRHLIPHMAPLAAIYMMVTVTGAIVADGFLAFFGLNPDPLNWGTMVYNGFAYNFLNPETPWFAIVAPAMAISLFAASFYMISRGLQDVIEPRLRSEYLS